jgi:NDP-4-keto-2,6-dideoxyhexose 3-C-methyltransferase
MRTIKTCRSCGFATLEDIMSLGDIKLSDFVDMAEPEPKAYPLNLVLCTTCKLVQLKETTPPENLYNDRYGYKSGISNTIRADLKDVVEKAKETVFINDHDTVIDIASNDGTLLSNYPKNLYRVGFDPVEKYAPEAREHASMIYPEYFTFKQEVPKAKVITAISCFYDLDNPNQFVEDLTKSLHDNGVIILQQNYLVSMLLKNAFCNIVHEHIEYYSLLSLEDLLNRHGLEVFDVETSPINGGSFRTYIAFMGTRKVTDAVHTMRANERSMGLDTIDVYHAFKDRVTQSSEALRAFVTAEAAKGKETYIYGASTRGNTLLQVAGLTRELLPAAVERNPEKVGKKIASLGVPIISEESARKDPPAYFLVCPWFFRDEIVEREAEYIKNGGSLIFPLPRLEVVNDKRHHAQHSQGRTGNGWPVSTASIAPGL